MLLGNEVTVYMWDERYSSTYAAMRLGNRPRFDGEAHGSKLIYYIFCIIFWYELKSSVLFDRALRSLERLGQAFKRWITVRQGLNWGAKALLDAEAARAILEHWLSKDDRSEIINKELQRLRTRVETAVSFTCRSSPRGWRPLARPARGT